MKVVFLGTGTSVGVPAIGCRCAVCRSRDLRNRRTRASLYVVAAGRHLIIDTTPDFRTQVLQCGVRRVDALLYTHAHADHVCGFDDVRRFSDLQDQAIPVFALPATIRVMNRLFPYVHKRALPGLSYPRVCFTACRRRFRFGAVVIEPLPVDHAGIPTCGYRIAAEGIVMAYIPDCHGMAPEVEARLRGLDLLIIDALKRQPHPTHFCLEESLALIARTCPRRAFLTHMGHDLDHAATQKKLPRGVFVPYDGLTLHLRCRAT